MRASRSLTAKQATSAMMGEAASPSRGSVRRGPKKTGTIRQPEMTFKMDSYRKQTGAAHLGLGPKPLNTEQTKRRRKMSPAVANQSGYMAPTFSRVMTMAVSGQVVAEVAHDERGRPQLVATARVDEVDARGVGSFLYVTKPEKRWARAA